MKPSIDLSELYKPHPREDDMTNNYGKCGKCPYVKINRLYYKPPAKGYLKIFECHKLGRPVNPENIHADCPIAWRFDYRFTKDELDAIKELAETSPDSAGLGVILDILQQASDKGYICQHTSKDFLSPRDLAEIDWAEETRKYLKRLRDKSNE